MKKRSIYEKLSDNIIERYVSLVSPVSLLSVVSKVFEKLVNNRIVNHLEKSGLFSDF